MNCSSLRGSPPLPGHVPDSPGPGTEVAGWAASCGLLFASPLAAATGLGKGTEAAGWAAGCELLFASALAAAIGQGPGTEAAGWAAGCELLVASPLAAAIGPGPGPGPEAAGWAAGCELLFALPLAAATGLGPPGPGDGGHGGGTAAGCADGRILDETVEQLLARFCTDSASAPSSSSRVTLPIGISVFYPWSAGRELSRTHYLSAPACEAQELGWTLGRALWKVSVPAWSPCLVEAHQGAPPPPGEPLCREPTGLATPLITPWWPCSLPAPTEGPCPLVHPYLCLVMVFTQHLRPYYEWFQSQNLGNYGEIISEILQGTARTRTMVSMTQHLKVQFDNRGVK